MFDIVIPSIVFERHFCIVWF